MSRRRAASPTSPPPDPAARSLSFNELRVVNAWEATGFRQEDDSAIRAYVSVYGCKRESAKSAAPRLLSRVHVQAEIARRIAATQVVTPETLGACLVKYRTWAEDAKDYLAGASICMDQAKLAGLIVSKSEVTQRTDVHEAMRQVMRRRRLDAAGGSATATPLANGQDAAVSATENGHTIPSAATETPGDSADA